MRKTFKRIALPCALAGGLALTACGGGGGDVAVTDQPSAATTVPDTAAASTVPDTAVASTAALVSFELGLSPDDRAEPLNLGNLKLPVDDLAEPSPV
jgi:hypothetical protein